jgi:demethylmenaquinone methyltransferase/2-methoxy-6-polyprenyl-1,4-benzoquinol methylase
MANFARSRARGLAVRLRRARHAWQTAAALSLGDVVPIDPRLLRRDPDMVSRMFGEVAPRYDLLNRVLSLGLDASWRRAAVRMARPGAARRVLDLATGTGDLALAFARENGFCGEVLGLDFSPDMIRRAQGKAAVRGVVDRVRFREGDALAVPEPDGSFDIVSIAFGVRNFADVEKGLIEARRVLVPGGRLVVLEFFQRCAAPLLRFYLDEVVPRAGRWISRSPTAYAYLRDSTRGFLRPEEFVALLDALGFSPIAVRKLTWGIAHCVVATKTASPVSR